MSYCHRCGRQLNVDDVGVALTDAGVVCEPCRDDLPDPR
jgi:recombinational DNA repair protein (RecF pathway)